MIINKSKFFINSKAPKRTFSLILALFLTFSMTSCKKMTSNSDEEYEKADAGAEIKYVISLINSDERSISENLMIGLTDSLDDLLGQGTYALDRTDAYDKNSCDKAILDAVKGSPNLIIANGYLALTEASAATTSIPIVGTGVQNFQAALHTGSNNFYNAYEGNITGTSTLPPMTDVMSLILETQPQIGTVGLLYSPEDKDAIYQNEILEKYMDEAQIPWKEYELNASESMKLSYNSYPDLSAKNSESSDSALAIIPSGKNFENSMQGPDTDPVIIGQSDLFSTAATPTSARAPKISALLTATDITEADETNTKKEDDDTPSISNGASNADIVKYACSECNILFIPGLSNISDQAKDIEKVALESKVPTVSCDKTAGEHTLACLYTDPYAYGYSAGKQIYRILVKEETPDQISIESSSRSESVKLFNKKIASSLERDFPKSFHEIESYLSETLPGACTDRVKESVEKK